jgi:hypothetical protein
MITTYIPIGLTLGGIALIVIGVNGILGAARAKRANQLHDRYFVADRSRAFVAFGALLVALGGTTAFLPS